MLRIFPIHFNCQCWRFHNTGEHIWDFLGSHGLTLIDTNPNEIEYSASEVDKAIIIATVVLNGLWLVSAIALLYGNSVKSKALITFWMIITIIMIPFKAAETGYYGFKLQSIIKSSNLTVEQTIRKNLSTFYLLICCSIGTTNILFNGYFFMVVSQRLSEIKKNIKETLGDFTAGQPQVPLSTYPNHTMQDDRSQLPRADQSDNVIPLDNNNRRYSRPDLDEREMRFGNRQYGKRQSKTELPSVYSPDQDYYSRARYDGCNPESNYSPRLSSERLESEYDYHSRPSKYNLEPGYSSRPYNMRQSQHHGYDYRSHDVRSNSQKNYNPREQVNQGYTTHY
ncbi:uncharacterized protein LOC143230804 [Tachypleus tridentatus]|uniref:uncharacterized protein LOC143230804 n=1 Tax=Tachypleus tridentatus TaxID=6853 RepID=UPI003FD2EA75